MASIKFSNVFIDKVYSIATERELSAGLKGVNNILKDNYNGKETFEEAEIKMQTEAIRNLCDKDTSLVVGGDLSNQLSLLNYTMSKFNLSFLGVYAACSTFNASLIVLSNMIDRKKIKKGIAITSSKLEVAERQFRYPIEYGCPPTLRSTKTATCCVGVTLANKGSIKIDMATIGKVNNSYVKDVNNMGGVMAIGAYNTLIEHLRTSKRNTDYYDCILTGDLGRVGSKIFLHLLNQDNIKLKKYFDCGDILDKDEEIAGASGPVCLPLILFNKILPTKKYKRILIITTGSLHSPTLVNQKKEIPCISHAISLEVLWVIYMLFYSVVLYP